MKVSPVNGFVNVEPGVEPGPVVGNAPVARTASPKLFGPRFAKRRKFCTNRSLPDDVDIDRQRQMMRADIDVAGRKRHVLGQLALDREVSLIRVGVFKVLADRKRERQQRPKPGNVWSLKRWRPN